LGLFESYPTSDKKHFNFKQLDEAYFRLYCYKLFGKDVWPSPQGLQKITKDLKMVTNAFIVHGYYGIKCSIQIYGCPTVGFLMSKEKMCKLKLSVVPLAVTILTP
jgi:hypothetical protein